MTATAFEWLWTGSNCRAIGVTLPNGRYAVMTDTDGLSVPTANDWMVAVHKDAATWEEGAETVDDVADSDDGDPAGTDSMAAALLALVHYVNANPKGVIDAYDTPRMPDAAAFTEQAECILDPARGAEARDMLDDLCVRVFDVACEPVIARSWLRLAERDGIQPARSTDGGRTPADDSGDPDALGFWTLVLADDYHIRNR